MRNWDVYVSYLSVTSLQESAYVSICDIYLGNYWTDFDETQQICVCWMLVLNDCIQIHENQSLQEKNAKETLSDDYFHKVISLWAKNFTKSEIKFCSTENVYMLVDTQTVTLKWNESFYMFCWSVKFFFLSLLLPNYLKH